MSDITLVDNTSKIDEGLQELFVDGMYSRTGSIPKGTLIVGHIHRKKVINIISKGSILVKTDDEEAGVVKEAPCIFVTEPGSKKTFFTLSDVVFTNILRTDKLTTQEVEEEVIEPDNGKLPYMRRKELTECL